MEPPRGAEVDRNSRCARDAREGAMIQASKASATLPRVGDTTLQQLSTATRRLSYETHIAQERWGEKFSCCHRVAAASLLSEPGCLAA
jgi:hypothetical protein